MSTQKRQRSALALDEHLELYCEQRAKRPTLDPACEPGFLWIKRSGSSERLCGFAGIHHVKDKVFGKDAQLGWHAQRSLCAWFDEEAPQEDSYALKLLHDVHIHVDSTPAAVVLTRGDQTALSASEMGLLERRLAWYREVAALEAAFAASPTPNEPEYPTQEVMVPFELLEEEEGEDIYQ